MWGGGSSKGGDMEGMMMMMMGKMMEEMGKGGDWSGKGGKGDAGWGGGDWSAKGKGKGKGKDGPSSSGPLTLNHGSGGAAWEPPMSAMGGGGAPKDDKPKGDGKWKPDYERDPVANAIHNSLEPVAELEIGVDLLTLEDRVGKYFFKEAQRYIKDERLDAKGSEVQGKALIEEFVESIMGALSSGNYDKEWYQQCNFQAPLFELSKQTFGNCKVFSRVLNPHIERFVTEALFRFRDEERIQKCFGEAVANIGLDASYHKKATKQLATSFDEAHTNAPYGTSQHALPAMRVLQDFVLGWMKDFANRAWDVLDSGVSTDRESQMIFLTALFQTLTGPELRAMPYDIVGLFDSEDHLPQQGWDYVALAAQHIFEEWDQQSSQPKSKKRRGGGGGGGGYDMPALANW